MKDIAHELLNAFGTFLLGLMPAALGSAVSLVYETGLTWSRRFVQLLVGVVVSYFITNVASIWLLNPFVIQAIGFVVGMIAYKATPKFIAACSDTIATAPAQLLERALSWLPKKKGAGE